MKWFDILKLSSSNLWRRKLRSVLTLLGVIIGTAAIVTMLSIGLGMTKAMLDMIKTSADLTTIRVYGNSNVDMLGGGMMVEDAAEGSNQKDEVKLNKSTLDMFKTLPHVAYVSPVLELNLRLVQGGFENSVTVQGMTEEALKSKNIYLTEGKMPDFSKSSEFFPLIIGQDIINSFYNPNSQNWEPKEVDMIHQPVFATIETYSEKPENDKPKKYPIKADGIMGAKDEMSWSENMYAAYTEINCLENFLTKNFRGKAWPGQPATKTGKPLGETIYPSAYIGSEDLKYTKDILNQIRDMGFMVDSNMEFIDSMRKQALTQQLVLGGIGGISLLVAAIGIANTMMMSVYERTKEIGIFKVLGCSLNNIRNMFLAEAALLGLLGGILGVGLSFIVSTILNFISKNSVESFGVYGGSDVSISIIPFWLIISAILFSTLIGIIAGVLPARRAMKLSALEAIRNN